MSWQALQGDFAAIYMNAFTEAHAVQPSLRGSPENR
jgi:hypothetical protein